MWSGVCYRYRNGIAGLTLVCVDFHLGGALWIATPAYKVPGELNFFQRCLQVHIGFILFFVELNIPLWIEGV